MARVGIEHGQGRELYDVPIAVTTGTTELVAAPDAPKRVKVVSYVIVADSACTVKFADAAGDKSGAMSFADNGGVVASGQPSSPFFSCGIASSLDIVTTGSVNGHLSYVVD